MAIACQQPCNSESLSTTANLLVPVWPMPASGLCSVPQSWSRSTRRRPREKLTKVRVHVEKQLSSNDDNVMNKVCCLLYRDGD